MDAIPWCISEELQNRLLLITCHGLTQIDRHNSGQTTTPPLVDVEQWVSVADPGKSSRGNSDPLTSQAYPVQCVPLPAHLGSILPTSSSSQIRARPTATTE